MTQVIGETPYLGQLAGRVRLIEALGAGGMGAVYIGEHVSLPGSRKVVKLLLPDSMNNAFVVQHFGVEARAAAKLHHANIIAIEDVGQLDTGEPYITMEYLKGTDVNALCKKLGPLPLQLATQIAVQACSALSFAHRQGVIHRDIKPHNLFLIEATGVVKVLDFGIAKAMDPGVAGGAQTATQQVCGSPGFMPPEQARTLQDVDHRGDIFSLAASLYFMVTGQLPFANDSYAEYVWQLSNSQPVDPQKLRPDLPDAWKYTLLQGLAKHPHERPADIREFGLRLIGDVPRSIEIANTYAADLVDGTVFKMSSAHGGAPGGASGPAMSPSASLAQYAGAVSRPATTTGQGHGRLWLAVAGTAIVSAGLAVAVMATRGGHDSSSSGAAAGTGSSAALNANLDARTAVDAQLAIATPDAAPIASAPVDAAQIASLPIDAGVALAPDAATAAVVPGSREGSGHEQHAGAIAHVGTGSLEVYVEPWAYVKIDGHPEGQTPVTGRTLAIGVHKVSLSNPDSGKQESISVTIRAGRTTTVERKW